MKHHLNIRVFGEPARGSRVIADGGKKGHRLPTPGAAHLHFVAQQIRLSTHLMPGPPRRRELGLDLPLGQRAAIQRRNYLLFLKRCFSKFHNLGREKHRVVFVRKVGNCSSLTVVQQMDTTVWFYLIAKIVLGKVACPAEKEPEGFV